MGVGGKGGTIAYACAHLGVMGVYICVYAKYKQETNHQIPGLFTQIWVITYTGRPFQNKLLCEYV